ncbi:MAG: GTPase HflX [Bacillota bacterium]
MAITGENIGGSKKGVSDFWLEQLEALADVRVPKEQLFSEELALAMAIVTKNIGSEICVYIDRHGRIVHTQVGDKHSVNLENMSKRDARHHLSGLRCIHTHPNGDGSLSLVDLTAMPQLKFDAMVALGVDVNAKRDDYLLKTVGVAFGVLGDDKPKPFLCKNIKTAMGLDFWEMVFAIEKAAAKDLTYYDLSKKQSKALLINITGSSSEEKARNSLSELSELAETAGLLVADTVLQKKPVPDVATFVGRGKADELRFLSQILGIDSLVFDSELTPVQIRNLEAVTGRAIIDRSMLILDIFAQRANSNEGKLQVELAQLKYMMPRLVGQGEVLSRLGGGIGTRGPGETKLEVDRRVIRKRINELENKLDNVVKTRKLHRKHRQKENMSVVALVGYTNAGKSTLLNALTEADVLAENKLFATLDTTTRKLELPSGRLILLSDTVGFIRNLPHHLVAAFRATLEEVVEADLLLHVMDCSSEEIDEQVVAVNQVLASLGCADKATVAVLNKVDKIDNPAAVKFMEGHFDNAIAVSAKEQRGIAELLQLIALLLPKKDCEIKLILPYTAGSELSLIHENGKVTAEEYTERGIMVEAVVPLEVYGRLAAKYEIINEN